MALLWIEGFEGVGSTDGAAPSPTGILLRKYAYVGYPPDQYTLVRPGRIAGHSIEYTAGWPDNRTGPLTTNATMIVGFGYYFSAAFNGKIIGLYDFGQQGMNVRLTSAGELAVYRDTTVLATTSGLGLTTATWYYIEFKVLCDGSAGSYELRVDGTSKLSASGINTKAGSHTYHNIFQMVGSQSGVCRFDDLYILDGSGSANNDFLGKRRAVGRFPSGDVGGYQDFTCSSGSNHYALVDENPVNDDTDYVEDGTIGHKDLWDYPSLSGTGSTINGIQINSMARETDATSMTLNTLIKSGATEDAGTGEVVGSTTYKVMKRISETDPNTGVAWTVSGVNAAQFGVKVG